VWVWVWVGCGCGCVLGGARVGGGQHAFLLLCGCVDDTVITTCVCEVYVLLLTNVCLGLARTLFTYGVYTVVLARKSP